MPAGPAYDCVILSGGGAKGAYGAGVAKAIERYRGLRKTSPPTCYIGSSAGALNAYMLATDGADKLINFWLDATNRSILGATDPNPKTKGATRWIWRGVSRSRAPYSIFSNQKLRSLIEETASLKALKSPLIVASADYTRGSLTSFYSSPLIEELVQRDAQADLSRRRLGHLRKIESDAMLVNVLLASAAIPIFFPPVQIAFSDDGGKSTSWFVDGGVGNHTPTREAAYFMRYLEETDRGKAGLAFCVSQDPPHTIQDLTARLDLSDILTRTLEVYHTVHTRPIVTAWKRINAEVRDLTKRTKEFKDWLAGQDIPEPLKKVIGDEVFERFGKIGGETPRLGVPLVEIEPSVGLGEALDFNPARARENIVHGYTDTLKSLHRTRDRTMAGDQTLLNEGEYQALLAMQVFPPRNPSAS